MSSAWTHDGLAADLAQYLRSPQRMVWEDMQLGPSGSPRPDVFTIEKSYSKPLPTAYEVKISRSDLRSDLTSGKWQPYLKYAGAVSFGVPDGLATVADIPTGCGLIVRKDQVWRWVRRPTRQTVALPMDACMKLLIDGVSRTSGARQPRCREAGYWAENEKVRKKFGQAVALAARNLALAEQRAQQRGDQERRLDEAMRHDVEAKRTYLMEQARKERAQMEAAKNALIEWLGLEADASSYAVQRAIAAMKKQCDTDARVEAAERALSSARSSVQHALHALTPDAAEKAW